MLSYDCTKWYKKFEEAIAHQDREGVEKTETESERTRS